MSGHSKWSTIKRQKGAADARRGQAFTKLGNAITIAVRQGGGNTDPDFNFKLRLAVEKAREANMPKENIQRAIERGGGKGDGAQLNEAIFEGFLPGGGAVIIEAISDNINRTSGEIRNLLNKGGGNLGGQGSVVYLFQRVGEIIIERTGQDMDTVLEKAIEAGAKDLEETEDSYSVYSEVEDLHRVKERLAAVGLKILDSELVFRPNKETLVTLPNREIAGRVENLLASIEELDDVQSVFSNVDFKTA